MAQAAMEQMKRMSPEQIQAMMKSVGGMSPQMMQQAMAQMKNMRPDDLARAQQQMSCMDPSDLARQAAQASSHYTAQQNYVIQASKQLKAEGNQLHQEGRYQEAAEKYEKAKTNMDDFSSCEAQNLRKACLLNLSNCYLKMEQWSLCEGHCNEVLREDPDNLKALYRRGQALAQLGRSARAVQDLKAALRQCVGDPVQTELIEGKLKEVQVKMEAEGQLEVNGSSMHEEPAPANPREPASRGSPSHTTSNSGDSAASWLPPAGALDPSMVQQVKEMMVNNPGLMQEMVAMMDNMDAQELSAHLGKTVTSEMMDTAKQTMKTMTPEQLDAMAKMSVAVGGSNPTSVQSEVADRLRMQQAATMDKSPESIKLAAEMMAKMTPEDLEQMNRMAEASGTALKVTPEMAKMAAEQIKSMTPQQLSDMTKMMDMMQKSTTSTDRTPSSTGSTQTAAAPVSAVTSTRGVTITEVAEVDGTVEQLDEEEEESSDHTSTGPGMRPAPDVFDPAQARMMSEMFAGMSVEQLNALTSSAASIPGMPKLPPMTPEMMKMAVDMMSNMSAEDMQKMQQMAMQSGLAGRGSSGGGVPTAEGLPGLPPGLDPNQLDPSMLNDPAMMDSIMAMMKNMDESTLVSMFMSSGICKNRGQAEGMATQIKSLSDDQVRMMMKAAAVVHKGVRSVGAVKEFIASKAAFVLALIVLMVAIILRWWGIL